jgi:hypothetical protein
MAAMKNHLKGKNLPAGPKPPADTAKFTANTDKRGKKPAHP